MPGAKGGTRAAGDSVEAAYQDLLQDLVEKKQKAAEVRRRPPKKRKGPVVKAALAVILPPIAAALWIFQPFASPPPAATRPPDERAAWQTTLLDVATVIREFRDSAGGFPADLASAGVRLSGVTYTITGPEQFSLQTYTSDGLVTVWMSGEVLGIGSPPLAGTIPTGGVP